MAMQIFMRQKLDFSRGLMEGMVLERFDLIVKNTVQLRKMNQTNVWIQTTNALYIEKMTNYQARLDQLFIVANDRDVEATSLAYGNVVKSCVECHRVVRKEQLYP
jgi:hypothetical protein